MQILVGDWIHVDFGGPVRMSDEEFDKFINFLESMYSVVEIDEDVESVLDCRIKRLGEQKTFGMTWTAAEYELLLGTDSTEELMEKLGRSAMSIMMRRGKWVSDFNYWVTLNGYEIRGNLKELIKKYLSELEEAKKLKKEKRKMKSTLLKCSNCGLLHDPEIYKMKHCFMDGENLSQIRVSPEEKNSTYKEQPYYIGSSLGYGSGEYANFFKKYPPEEAEDEE